MAVEIKTKTTDLPESRKRVEVEVPAEEIQSGLDRTAKLLGREMKLPGFRQGKVPADIVLKRLGREAVFQQMLQDRLDEWYRRSLSTIDIDPIGEPKLEFGELPDPGEALNFSLEVGVRPVTKLGKYKGIEAGKREVTVPDGAVDAEIERLRQSVARLEPVERPLKEGDYAVLDFEGKVDGEPFEGGLARDYSLEIGSNRLLEGFEQQLVGASANDQRKVEVVFPEDYSDNSLSGKKASFDVKVKAVQEVKLPGSDDELAGQVSEFDTIGELRSDIYEKLFKAQESKVEAEYADAVIDSAVGQSEIELPDDLVYARAHEMWHKLEHRLEHQGITPDQYSEITGKGKEQVLSDLKVRAEQDIKRESLLIAVAEKEGLEVTDDEMLEAIEAATQGESAAPEDLLEQLKSSGQYRAFREDLVTRKVVKLLVEESKPINVEQAKAKEVLWTPGKEPAGDPAKVWTP